MLDTTGLEHVREPKNFDELLNSAENCCMVTGAEGQLVVFECRGMLYFLCSNGVQFTAKGRIEGIKENVMGMVERKAPRVKHCECGKKITAAATRCFECAMKARPKKRGTEPQLKKEKTFTRPLYL